jgi:hypothetical protein
MSAVTMLSAEIHGFVPALYYSAGNYTTLGSVRRLAVTEIGGQTQRIEARVTSLKPVTWCSPGGDAHPRYRLSAAACCSSLKKPSWVTGVLRLLGLGSIFSCNLQC